MGRQAAMRGLRGCSGSWDVAVHADAAVPADAAAGADLEVGPGCSGRQGKGVWKKKLLRANENFGNF